MQMQSTWILICIGLLFAIAFGGSLFFRFSRNTLFKKTWYPIYSSVTAGAGFLLFAANILRRNVSPASIVEVALLAAFMGLGTFWMVRRTRFCDSCGLTVFPQSLFQKDSFCRRCGSKL